ncbi:MAG: IS630 family transposase [Butyricicoccus sp.]|nr:IS630 family transposase [Butyricicoccus sp.]
MREKRRNWEKSMFGYNPAKLVFLDESGVNTDMTRRYARAIGGKRSVDSAPLNKPKNTTILSSVRLNGETAYTTYQGGTTSERFTEYLKTVLIPTLEPDSVVVMDNMRSHHTKAVKSLLEQAQVHYVYLPPYSPDLNPIEKMWSKLMAFLRKKKVRLAQDLPGAVRQAFDAITPQDCAGWFRSCGYSG